MKPSHIVVAASGGVDSTALLLAVSDLRRDGFSVTCGHVNHHLRGSDSDTDEAFVRNLCHELGIDVDVRDGTLAPQAVKEIGIEAAARDVRIARLQEIRSSTGAGWIVTAHQKNDQAETVLMRLFGGGGIGALRGIRPVRDDGILRPLLGVRRDEIEAFLRERGVTARVDRSNADPRFFRNRVRHLLDRFEPAVIENLAGIAEQAQLLWPHVERVLDDAERASAVVTATETRFDAWPEDLWLRQALLHRHIRRLDPGARDVSSSDLLRIAAEAPNVKRMSITKRLELVRKGSSFVVRRPAEPAGEFEIGIRPGATAFIAEIGAALTLSPIAAPPARFRFDGGARQIFQLPSGSESRFTIRNRREGDRFHPLGLGRAKKLKDFLIDRKIAVETRDRLPLLLWNGEIVWIGGVEVSERFKVTDPPGELYEVRLESTGAFREADQGQAAVHRKADRQTRRGPRRTDPKRRR